MTDPLTRMLDEQRREQERIERERGRQTLFARSATERRRGQLADRPGFGGVVAVGAASGQLTDARLAARIEQLREIAEGPRIREPGEARERQRAARMQVEEFDRAQAAERGGRAEQRRIQTGEEFTVRDRILELRRGLEDLAEPAFADPSEITDLEKLLADLTTLGEERSGRHGGREDVAELRADLEARLEAARARRRRPETTERDNN